MSANNNDTRVDRWVKSLKNHPLVAVLIFLGVVVVAIGSFTDAVEKLAKLFGKEKEQISASVKQKPIDSKIYPPNKDSNALQAIDDKAPQAEIPRNQAAVKNQDMPSIPEIVTRNEEERIVLPGTTTNFFQGDVRVAVVAISVAPGGTYRTKAKLAGDEGIKNIRGEVGDVFEFGRFKEYRVSISELNGNYAVFNIKRRELSTAEITKKAYPDLK